MFRDFPDVIPFLEGFKDPLVAARADNLMEGGTDDGSRLSYTRSAAAKICSVDITRATLSTWPRIMSASFGKDH